MASYRIGIGSFNLKDGAVGIGTESSGLGNLKVEGTIKTTDLDVGVSTFTRYSGFEGEETKFDKDVTLSGEYSTTGDIVVDTGATLTVGLGSTACIGSVECISVKHHFSVPVGDTAGRNKSSGYAEGTVRYNRDLGTMEFFNGNEWRQFTYIADIQNSPSSRGRGVFSGFSPGLQNGIQFVEIMTKGNSLDFGTNETGTLCAGTSNGTRGVYSGGAPAPYKNKMEYITIASQGNGIDFGDLTQQRGYAGGASSSTRGLVIGGYFNPAYTNVIDYHQISTLGDAIDFGDVSATGKAYGSTESPVRAVHNAGNTPDTSEYHFLTISTKGNSIDFGESTQRRQGQAAAGNSVRGIFSGGYLGGSTHKSTIDYVTLASEGNAIDFGDRTFSGSYSSAASNSVRVVSVGGFTPSYVNTEEFVTIATTGNAQDFGDSAVGSAAGAVSDSHGGLGGY